MLTLLVLSHFLPGSTLGPLQGPEEISIRQGLAIQSVGVYGRAPIHIDPIQRQIVEGRWQPPKEGETVSAAAGASRTWAKIEASPDGWFSGPALNGGYLFAEVRSAATRTMVLEAAGHSMVYVNGEPRVGDPYSHGYVRLPVELRPGVNTLLFHGGRGRLRASLSDAKERAQLNLADATLPDLVESNRRVLGAVVVMNTTTQWQRGLTLESSVEHARPVANPVPPLPPLSIRKVGFGIVPGRLGEPATLKLRVRLLQGKTECDSGTPDIRRRLPNQSHKRTFESQIDGSVQYYAVQPAQPSAPKPPRLVLSLHGASVEAIGQADAYAANSWATIVCPTNRRPYGFDWEDTGRLDALEVMGEAERSLGGKFHALTGHSMGGHGTWHLGVTFPGRFAAIGPSAGWVSFFSYGGTRRLDPADPIEALLQRATNPSDTLQLASNLKATGVYILHGDADDNVPVREARTMRDHLAKLGIAFHYHEQPGAGHWWETSDEPGAECVDWPPMFDFFARRQILERPREIDFTTANPFVSSECHWVAIHQQQRPLEFSRVQIRFDPHRNRYVGTTQNVEALSIHLAKEGATLDLDGTTFVLRGAEGSRIILTRESGRWHQVSAIPPGHKNPARSGPFKSVVGNRLLLVYGTRGSSVERDWSFGKARFDAESFWYRGNGSLEIIPDHDYREDRHGERNAIFYGNEQTNEALARVIAGAPLRLQSNLVSVGGHRQAGSAGMLAVWPAAHSSRVLLGVIGGTDLVGMRLCDRLPVFVSGVAYPDWIVLSPEALAQGTRGVVGAGYFDNRWMPSPTDSAWR